MNEKGSEKRWSDGPKFPYESRRNHGIFAKEVDILVVLVIVELTLGLDELEDEGVTCVDVVAAWEEFSAAEGFEKFN